MERLPSDGAILMIGLTGAGKSETANTIAGEPNLFPANSSVRSTTQENILKKCHWFNEHNSGNYTIIDTPGLGDSEGKDFDHLSQMVDLLINRGLPQLKSFVLVMNGQFTRLDQSLQKML